MCDHVNSESINTKHVALSNVRLPITDATPAIQSALQNLRQQFNLVAQNQVDDRSNSNEVSALSTSKDTTNIFPNLVSINTSQLQYNVNTPLLPLMDEKMQPASEAVDASMYHTIDQIPLISPLNQKDAIENTLQPNQLAWHTPTIIHANQDLHSENDSRIPTFSNIGHNSIELIDMRHANSDNVVVDSRPTTGINISLPLETYKSIEQRYLNMPIHDEKSCIGVKEQLNEPKDLSDSVTVCDSILLETSQKKRGKESIIDRENAKIQKLVDYSTNNNLDDLGSSFSSSETSVGPGLYEVDTSATPFLEIRANECGSVLGEFGYSAFNSVSNVESLSSNINVSLIENCEDSNPNIDDVTNESSFDQESGIANQNSSSFDLMDNPNNLPLYSNHESPNSEVASPLDDSVKQYSNSSTGSKLMRRMIPKSTSFNFAGTPNSPSCATQMKTVSSASFNYKLRHESLTQVFSHAKDAPNFDSITDVPTLDDTTNDPFSRIKYQDLTMSNISAHATHVKDKILDDIRTIDVQPSLLPNLLNDSFLPSIDDKQFGLPSLEFNHTLLSNSGPITLPSLDHPLDFENLMDLDSLPLDK